MHCIIQKIKEYWIPVIFAFIPKTGFLIPSLAWFNSFFPKMQKKKLNTFQKKNQREKSRGPSILIRSEGPSTIQRLKKKIG